MFETEVSSAPSISSVDLCVLVREATFAARRLVHRLGLPSHEHEDLRQELLVDLIARFKWFNPGRGTLGVFAGTITRHHATRLANHIRREHAVFEPMSPPDGTKSCDTFETAHGHVEVDGPSHDHFAQIERRVDLARALGSLQPADLSLCAQLIERSPTEISRSGEFSRAGVYRRLRSIRLRLLAEGVSCP